MEGKIMSVPIIGKEQDLPGCVCAPVFLQELMGQCDDDVKPSIKTFLELMGELAFFIARVRKELRGSVSCHE